MGGTVGPRTDLGALWKTTRNSGQNKRSLLSCWKICTDSFHFLNAVSVVCVLRILETDLVPVFPEHNSPSLLRTFRSLRLLWSVITYWVTLSGIEFVPNFMKIYQLIQN
jgi:hypothetical protein